MSKYVITDPCYILDDATWSKCCKLASPINSRDWNSEVFDTEVSKALKQFANSDNAWVSETGFGDWNNYMCGDEGKVLSAEFGADSGMVCVCELTPSVEAALKTSLGSSENSLVSIIECTGKVSVEFDKSNKNWTVVYIDDDEGQFNSLIQ